MRNQTKDKLRANQDTVEGLSSLGGRVLEAGLTVDGSLPFCPEKSSGSGRVSNGDRFSLSTLSSTSVSAVSNAASPSSSMQPLI